MLFLDRNSALKTPSAEAHGHLAPVKEHSARASIGLDIGTASIISCASSTGDFQVVKEQNAFFMVPGNPRTIEILSRQNMTFLQKESSIYILGNLAEKSADIFKQNTNRPMRNGLLNPGEPDGVDAIMEIVARMIPEDRREGARVCFSVPGDPIGQEGAVVYHEAMLKMHLKSLGFKPQPVNEGLAVILSETECSSATALGISIGGGMCNICLAYLSMPVIAYSLQKGGDHIDERVGYAVNETATHIKLIKERSLDLSVAPKDRIDTALHIYYDDLFKSLARSLQQELGSSDKVCRLPDTLPLIVSGGTMLPPGSLEKFKAALADVRLPIKISDIVKASTPAEATARGALKMAQTK